MGMTINDAIDRFSHNAEYERTHGNLQGCLEFRQLTEWLKDYKRLKEQESNTDATDINVGSMMAREEREESIRILKMLIPKDYRGNGKVKTKFYLYEAILNAIEALEKEQKADKYEYHIDHTDCIWYGSNGVYPNTCPNTCSQYRDGWNDAMEYIYKDGKGYQPYRRK